MRQLVLINSIMVLHTGGLASEYPVKYLKVQFIYIIRIMMIVVIADGCGYLEDRRPSSNCDPYLVTESLVRTTLLDWKDFDMSFVSTK